MSRRQMQKSCALQKLTVSMLLNDTRKPQTSFYIWSPLSLDCYSKDTDKHNSVVSIALTRIQIASHKLVDSLLKREVIYL